MSLYGPPESKLTDEETAWIRERRAQVRAALPAAVAAAVHDRLLPPPAGGTTVDFATKQSQLKDCLDRWVQLLRKSGTTELVALAKAMSKCTPYEVGGGLPTLRGDQLWPYTCNRRVCPYH